MTTDDPLPALEIWHGPRPVEASDIAASVIWLHGLGADGHDFEPIVPELGLPADRSIHFVFPHAPVRPVTLNGGMAMRAWYDIASLDARRDEDQDGILESARQVSALIDRECARGVSSERIVLAGFSQGGAMAGYVGVRYPERLAGLVILSAYLLLPERLESERSDANRSTPIFAAHGQYDPVVPLAWGEANRTALADAGYPVEWGVYPTAHSVERSEIDALGQWFRARVEGA